ncbi:Potassium efflux system KefA protein [Salmonella enterica subsp. enterica serovar Typhimurium]|nr:Potassium efflux system KefA protein [Salmonella enterica subsp. enterica serovar Typhimurium]
MRRLQTALNALEERKGSLERAKQYQHVIDNFPKLSATLRAQLNNLRDEPRSVPPEMSTEALNQEILQVSSQLLDKTREAQQEQERVREIADSLSQLPQQQNDAAASLMRLSDDSAPQAEVPRLARRKVSVCRRSPPN